MTASSIYWGAERLHLSLFHLPLPKTSVQNTPFFSLPLTHSRCHWRLLGFIGWFSLLLENHLPFHSDFLIIFFFFLQNCDLHLGWLPGWFSRTFLQNVPGSIVWTDVISHISFSAEGSDSSKMGKCCSVITVESLIETDRAPKCWWKALQNCTVWPFLAQIWLQQMHNFLTKKICNWFPKSCLQPFRNSSSAPLSLY